MTIEGAWLPVPNDDASRIACDKGVVQDGRVVPIAAGAASGWQGRELALSRGVELAPNLVGRQLVFVDVDTGAERDSGIDPAQNPGWWPQVAVEDGITISSTPDQHYVNGQKIATESGAQLIEQRRGPWFFFPVAGNGFYEFVVKHALTGAEAHRIRKPVINNTFDFANGQIDLMDGEPWLSWSEWDGRMHLAAPDGTRYTGPAGEGRGLVFKRSGVRYVVTITNEGLTPVWIVRPLDEFEQAGPAWVLRDVGFSGMRYVNDVAMGYSGGELQGRLGIGAIDFSAPRAVYVRPADPGPALPDIVIPTNLAPRWRGCLGGSDQAPGNFGGGDRTSGPILEGIGVYTRAPRAGEPWIAVAHHDRWRWIFTSPKEGGDHEQRDARTQAKLTGSMIVVYDDACGSEFHYVDLCKALKADGYAVCPMVLVRPLSPSDTAEHIVGRLRAALATLLAEGFDWCGIMRRVDVGAAGDWPGLLVAGHNLAVTAALELPELAHVKLECCYGAGDGRFVWGIDYERALSAATTTPTDAIPRTPVATEPTTPTPPVVTPPPPARPEPLWRRYISESEIERRRQEREAMGRSA